MTRILAFLLTLALAASASAQIVQPTQSISVQDSGTQCSTAGTCASWPLLNTSPGFIVQITGTFSGTLTFRGSADNTTFFDILATKVSTGVAATTTTTTGQYTITNSGLLTLRVVGTTIMSGGANITLTRGPGASARSGSGATFNSLATGDVLYASGTNVVSGLADVAVGQLFASGGVGVAPAYTATPTLLGAMTENIPGIATTGTDGHVLTNTTAATALATVQYSPRLKLCGAGWNSSGSASQTDCWGIENRPATVAGTTTSQLYFTASINGGAYSDVASLTNGGNFALSTITATQVNMSSGFRSSANGTTITMPSDGVVNFRNNAGSGLTHLTVASDVVYAWTTPTITSGFSTTAPSIAGKASAFAVTIAATPGVTGLVAFNTTFTNVPSVTCSNTITANAVQAVPTTTTVTLNGVWVAGDVIRCIALGY